ncbi:Lacal_2735 family protein [Ekhidna sp.]|uniref:Lacal_2735 family protein n=1 Tax=Ekhidna sp. TaxID=2608089 RepID=UPI0032EC9E7C
MIKFFKKSNIFNLQRQYDKLMHEAYILAKSNPEESLKKQNEAFEVQRKILTKGRY